MNIFAFSQIINRDIIIRVQPSGRIILEYDCSEITDGDFLRSMYGEGKTVQEALEDYVSKIKGRVIVFEAMTFNRVSYNVSQELEA